MNDEQALDTLRYFHAVAVDYDGTLARNGLVEPRVLGALDQARHRGVAVILVSGRILSELEEVFPEVQRHFDALVLENGAVMVLPGQQPQTLAAPCDPQLMARLEQLQVPFRRGQVLLASKASHETTVREVIADVPGEYTLVRNREEMMILPAGVTKGSGVVMALETLGHSAHNAIAVGDAENDHDFLAACELGVAVHDAVPALKAQADCVLDRDNGEGVADLLEQITANPGFRWPCSRNRVTIGHYRDGSETGLPGSQGNVLITGRSMSGKSYTAGLLTERWMEAGYSVCILDPEGDYAALGQLRTACRVGGSWPLPVIPDYEQLLRTPDASVIVDLSLLGPAEQYHYMAALLYELARQRARTGRPHWIVVDEAHRLPLADHMARARGGFCLVSYDPEGLEPDVWSDLDAVVVLAAGEYPSDRPDPLTCVSQRLGVAVEPVLEEETETHAVTLHRATNFSPQPVFLDLRSLRHVRHWHKYTHAVLPEEEWFHFEWNTETIPIARNVTDFHELLRQAPPGVILFHAGRHDFSRWFRQIIRDPEIAEFLFTLEQQVDACSPDTLVAETGRNLIRAIEHRYLE